MIGVEVESGVRAQPMSTKETRNGARNRSRAVWNLMLDIDYSVGLEGGLEEGRNFGDNFWLNKM